VLAVVLIAIAGRMAVPAVDAQWLTNPAWTTFVPATAVSFTISPEHGDYSVEDTITLNYRITNISNHALYVPVAWEQTCPAAPHVQAWLENSAGQRSASGYAGSCIPVRQTLTERMRKEAVLLGPGQYLDGRWPMTLKGQRLPAGSYRIEAMLTGWSYEKFTEAEVKELTAIGNPFLRGEVPASASVVLVR
jgi:hypothetical protein